MRSAREHAEALHRVHGDGAEVDRRAFRRRSVRVGARDREQVARQRFERVRFGRDRRERAAVFLRRAVLAQREVGFRADHGQRRAQLVRRVAGEAALAVERALQAVQHAVERGREAAQLVGARRQVEPFRQVVRFDLRRQARDAVERGEPAACDRAAREHGQHRQHGDRERERERDAAVERGDRVRVAPDGDRAERTAAPLDRLGVQPQLLAAGLDGVGTAAPTMRARAG